MNVSDLKKRKKALKLTTKELAYMAELPVSTVSKIMTGETKNPSYLTVDILDQRAHMPAVFPLRHDVFAPCRFAVQFWRLIMKSLERYVFGSFLSSFFS